MSVLRGNRVITVYPATRGQDEYGNEITLPGDPDSVGLQLSCLVQPSTSEENAALGLQVSTSYRVLSRTFPGGAQAVVRHDGRLWDVVGEPRRYTGSPATAHTTTYITARTPKES